RPDAPRWLAAVVERCLERDPRRRPRDGAALRRALEPRAARGGLAAALGAVALLGALGVAGALALAGRDRRPPPPPPPAAGANVAALVSDFLARSAEAYRRDDRRQARELAARALALDARNRVARDKLALLLRELGESDAALAVAERGVELAPSSSVAYENRE